MPFNPCSDASSHNVIEIKGKDCTPSNDIEKLEPSSRPNEDIDEGIWQERAPWAPPPSPSLNIITGLAGQPEVHLDPPPRLKPTPHSSSSTHATSIPLSPHSLSNRVITYLTGCVSRYFTSAPGIVEYSCVDILRNTQIGIDAEEIIFTSRAAVIKIAAVVTDSSGADRESEKTYEPIERRIEIRAKHKRVKEILRGERYYVAEDFYKKEIRLAFEALENL